MRRFTATPLRYTLQCLTCSQVCDCCIGANLAVPQDGDPNICTACGNLAVFTDELKLREPTAEELVIFHADLRVAGLQAIFLQHRKH